MDADSLFSLVNSDIIRCDGVEKEPTANPFWKCGGFKCVNQECYIRYRRRYPTGMKWGMHMPYRSPASRRVFPS